jgi:hypothetical protein
MLGGFAGSRQAQRESHSRSVRRVLIGAYVAGKMLSANLLTTPDTRVRHRWRFGLLQLMRIAVVFSRSARHAPS